MRKIGRHQSMHSGAPARAGWAVLLVLAALFGALGPAAVAAQEPTTVQRGELAVFARAHVAMNEARDQFHVEIAAAHEDPAKERAREAFEERVAEIFEEHPITRERYEEVVVLVSGDDQLRAALDELLEELTAESRGSSP